MQHLYWISAGEDIQKFENLTHGMDSDTYLQQFEITLYPSYDEAFAAASLKRQSGPADQYPIINLYTNNQYDQPYSVPAWDVTYFSSTLGQKDRIAVTSALERVADLRVEYEKYQLTQEVQNLKQQLGKLDKSATEKQKQLTQKITELEKLLSQADKLASEAVIEAVEPLKVKLQKAAEEKTSAVIEAVRAKKAKYEQIIGELEDKTKELTVRLGQETSAFKKALKQSEDSKGQAVETAIARTREQYLLQIEKLEKEIESLTQQLIKETRDRESTIELEVLARVTLIGKNINGLLDEVKKLPVEPVQERVSAAKAHQHIDPIESVQKIDSAANSQQNSPVSSREPSPTRVPVAEVQSGYNKRKIAINVAKGVVATSAGVACWFFGYTDSAVQLLSGIVSLPVDALATQVGIPAVAAVASFVGLSGAEYAVNKLTDNQQQAKEAAKKTPVITRRATEKAKPKSTQLQQQQQQNASELKEILKPANNQPTVIATRTARSLTPANNLHKMQLRQRQKEATTIQVPEAQATATQGATKDKGKVLQFS